MAPRARPGECLLHSLPRIPTPGWRPGIYPLGNSGDEITPFVVLGVVAGLLGAQGVAAQAAPEFVPEGADAPPRVNSLESGAWALSFSPRGFSTGTFGYTRFHSAERSTTWEARVLAAYRKHDSGSIDESITDLVFEVGPTFRRYWETERRVVPFFAHNYFVGYVYRHVNDEGDDRRDTAWADGHGVSLGAGAAVGLEWFPIRQMSLRGETGLRGTFGFDAGRQRSERFRHSSHGWGGSLGTYTAGLTVSLYLPPRER